MSRVFLSVVIPTYQRNDLLTLCLDKVSPENQLLDASFYEVIVTDDGSKSTAEELIKTKYPWVKWVQGPRKGPAANRNNGARYANGDWLVFTDDDCLPNSDWLKSYCNEIPELPLVRAFEGAIHADKEEELRNTFAECPINTTGGLFWSANIAVEKKLFHEVGGFDEGYLLAAQEDQQLYLDLLKHTTVQFLPNCVVVHPVRYSSLGAQLSKINAKSKNFVRYAKKNQGALKYSSASSFVIEQFKFHAISFCKHLMNGKFQESFVSLAWLCYGVPLNVFRFVFCRD